MINSSFFLKSKLSCPSKKTISNLFSFNSSISVLLLSTISKSKFPTVDASTDNILIGFQSSVIFLFFDKNCLNKLNK